MDVTLVERFFDSLIRRTLQNSLNWKKLIKLNNDEINANHALYMTLFENEYHKIVYHNSHKLHTPYGDLFLVYDWNESGYDGSINEGYSLYFQKNNLSDLLTIELNGTNLYRLKNAIDSVSDEQENDIMDFLKAFVADEESPFCSYG